MGKLKVKKFLITVYEKIFEIKMKIGDFFLRLKIGTPKIMTIDETIDYLIKTKCSICRFGDGELKIAAGESIKFQEYTDSLSLKLREILKNNNDACLVALTSIFKNNSWMIKKSYQYTWRVVEKNRKKWTELLDLNTVYGNAYITRCYMDWKDKSNSAKWFQKLKNLWRDEDIVFIEGEKSRLGLKNDLFGNAASIERILCPATNAYSRYNEILDFALTLPKEKLILLALGPTATVLSYELSKNGYRALDIGHVDIEYEWFLMNAKDKVKITGKYTSEAKGGEIVEDETDREYLKQIIKRIGC